jgi:hypothetical protein
LLGDVLGAALRVRGGTDESTDLGCDDHEAGRVSRRAWVATVFALTDVWRGRWV